MQPHARTGWQSKTPHPWVLNWGTLQLRLLAALRGGSRHARARPGPQLSDMSLRGKALGTPVLNRLRAGHREPTDLRASEFLLCQQGKCSSLNIRTRGGGATLDTLSHSHAPTQAVT